jgi:nucleotide-binding universal stress UspA family protein
MVGLIALLYGSDAERVLRQAPCPVLIARDC